MATYRTPDVYVEEISLFPPSVAEVETAVPAFIGHTEKAEKKGESLTLVPTKIDSMVEFQQYFGGAPSLTPTVTLDGVNNVAAVDLGEKKFFLFDSLRLFFANGGGKCYIVSVGDYNSTATLGNDTSGLLGGLKKLEKEDEPTILLCPDATLLGSTNLYAFQQQALAQCATLQDRVTVCDLKNSGDLDTDVQEFRDNIGINHLKYGAAYVPWLKTGFTKQVAFRDIALKRAGSPTELNLANLTKDTALKAFITDDLGAAITAVDTINTNVVTENLTGSNKTLKEQLAGLLDAYDADSPYADIDDCQAELQALFALLKDILHGIVDTTRNSLTDTATFKLKADLDTVAKNNKLDTELQILIHHHNAPLGFTADKLFDEADAELAPMIAAVNTITGKAIAIGDSDAAVTASYTNAANANARGLLARNAAVAAFSAINAAASDLVAIAKGYEKTFDTALADKFSIYKNILTKINEEINVLPPGGAVAGVYAMVDRTRGVWKAPANVSLSAVVAPCVRIDARDQEGLNIDVNAGKSVNAIRPFTGKGTLVWGARTLAGNDNEWRYVSVRRFFNMVEESLKKSTYWTVFEPNDANTWIKIKSMIENYLLQKWREGALAGAKPEQAFFVNIGLGATMTAQDILEGRMNVEIGMAVVRPAEFIILKFSHKMQEA